MQTFKLVSPFEPIHRRSFVLDDPEIIKATNARPLVGGEFLQLTTAYKMARGGDGSQSTPGTPDDEATVPSFCFFGEPGRTEMQAIGKGTFLYGGFFEADTLVFDGDGLSLGSPLSVYDVDYGGIIRRGLALAGGSNPVVGFVSRLPANNNSWLRFHTPVTT